MNRFLSLFTRENITLAIAVIGFILSIGGIVSNARSRRVKLSILISDYAYSSLYDHLRIYVQISNESTLPVAITRLQLIYDGRFFDCSPIPNEVQEHHIMKENRLVVDRVEYTLPMPISLDALAATHGYLTFTNPKETFPIQPNEVSLLVSTNRNRKLKLSIPVSLEKLNS